jgi:hypothetical protein
MCLMPPITAPFTCVQFMLSSSVSSTRPTEQTLSPRTRYKPRGTSADGSGSSGVRMILSTAPFRTCSTKELALVLRTKEEAPGSDFRAKGTIAYQICRLIACCQLPHKDSRVCGHNQDPFCSTSKRQSKSMRAACGVGRGASCSLLR